MNKRGGHCGSQRILAVALCAAALLGCTAKPASPSQAARSRHGMVAASTPYAAEAGAAMLERGGNAVDAAMAALFALTVTDPPMTSLGGRCQMVISLADGRIIGLGGATQAPIDLDPPEEGEEPRSGYSVAPVPGVPAAAAQAVSQYGRLSLSDVLQPAIELAENGFAVTPTVAEIWQQQAERLTLDAGARVNYLKPDGSAYRVGERFRHPSLARVLRSFAEGGPDAFYLGSIAQAMARDIARHGGYLDEYDLENYCVEPGPIVTTSYRGYQVATLGRRTWGHTLVEMLNILGEFEVGKGPPAAEDVELLARIVGQALDDRPQAVGTLEPKPNGIRLSRLSSVEFASGRAQMIRGEWGRPVTPREPLTDNEDAETTHLSAMDAEGNAVALTTSIGPRFGSRVATAELGFLYAHSYNMRSPGLAGVRARTEMSPAIVFKDKRPVLSIGAAGSERIPVAVFQVLSNVIDRGYPLAEAVNAPRLLAIGNSLRLHEHYPQPILDHLESLGYELELRDRGITRHLGIVHAVQFDPATQEFAGAADPSYDGAAAGPDGVAGR